MESRIYQCRFGVSELLKAILVSQNPAFGISGEGRPVYYIIKLNYDYYLHTLSFCIHFPIPLNPKATTVGLGTWVYASKVTRRTQWKNDSHRSWRGLNTSGLQDLQVWKDVVGLSNGFHKVVACSLCVQAGFHSCQPTKQCQTASTGSVQTSRRADACLICYVLFVQFVRDNLWDNLCVLFDLLISGSVHADCWGPAMDCSIATEWCW